MSKLILPPGYRQRERGFIINPFVLAQTGDPYWSNVKLLLHFEGTGSTLTDSSGTMPSGNWFPQGSVTQSTAQFKFGAKSFLFNGTTDYDYGLSDAAHDVQTATDFTIECWVRPTLDGNSATQYGLFTRRFGTANYGQYNCYLKGDGKVEIVSSFNGSSWGVLLTASAAGSVASGSWTHLAYVREGTRFSIYAGASGTGSRIDTTVTAGGNLMSDPSQYLTLGRGGATSGPYYNGYMDEFRITKGTARYTGTTYTVPTAQFPNNA